ncbi:hypothetical protein EZV62_008122 [Acer yangbiense]|uniref:Serine-threonine kinase receptor-associated protein n=1 Tax=Acer yangbiense TaxID=1000413 RepID=A0A5C7ICA8_9ROSI|nr:hypothetical protein EZV62_008122 [Acer yangbiense]
MRLITGSADPTAKLWNVQTGAQLYTFNFDSPARSVDFSVGDKFVVITTNPFMELTSAIHVKRIAGDHTEQTGESVLTLKGPQGRINTAVWGPLNRTIISAGEDAVICIWDSETGKLLKEADKEIGHKKTITTPGPVTMCLEVVRMHLQSQQQIIVPNALTRFFKKKFGPINALAFNPDGKRYSFCS